MKKLNYTILMLALIAFSSVSLKAQMDLPAPSPKAKVMQTAGTTEITIEYSSPGVKGREIFGDLVPYDQIWRTGANKATSIEFSKNVTINGTDVEAGKYSMFTIPGKESWTVILNNETELWGSGNYSEEDDAVRFTVEPTELDNTVERMRFLIEDFNNEKATIALEWANTRIDFDVMLHTKDQAMKSIKAALEPSWGAYASAARYAFEQADEMDMAMEWINESIEVKSTWYNNWMKARMLAEKGEHKEALKYAKKAKELGDQDDNFFYKDDVEEAIQEWAKM